MAVVGLGWVANHRHIPCILRHPKAKLIGVIDRKEEKVDTIKKHHRHVLAAVSDRGFAPWLDQIDAVVITTNPEAHFELARSALAAGKHVLVEKPFTMKPAEARELFDLSLQVNRVCAVSHNFLFSRSIQKLKSLIKNGALGQITGIEGLQMSNPRRRLPAWYQDLPLGLFYDESPHFLYLIRDLAGCSPKLIDAHMIPSQTGENTPYSISLSYEGVSYPIRISMLFQAPLSEWHLMVMGTRKLGIVDIFRDILIVADNDSAHKAINILKTSGSTISAHLLGTLSSGFQMLTGRLFYGTETITDHFIGAILENSIPADIHAKDGLEVIQMQHSIIENIHV